MRKFFTLLIVISTFHPLFAQDRTISGRLTSNHDGSPLPGVSITIKGTTTGTVTDAEGYYSIKVPIGATLVFAYVGMLTHEVVVTKNNLRQSRPSNTKVGRGSKTKRDKPAPMPGLLYTDTITTDQPGVAVLRDDLPSYKAKSNIIPSEIRSIKKPGEDYVIRSYGDPGKRTGFDLQFTSSFGVEQINQLPALQNQYAQGRPFNGNLTWRGAHQGEIFSWGPLLNTLEFDGSNYMFDKNGRLTGVGQGNGQMAKNHDALSFFRTGLATANELMVAIPGPKSSTVIFDLENRRRAGVLPNSVYKKINFSSRINNIKVSNDIQGNASISFNRSKGDLINRGANFATIIGSIYRTPPTFDNSNGLSPKNARDSHEAYRLQDGARRSHAPGSVDNPFGLVNELPDRETMRRLMASLNLRYRTSNPFGVTLNGNIDRQWSDNLFGIPTGYTGFPEGRLTRRDDNQTFINMIVTPSYRYGLYGGDLKLKLSYQTQYTGRRLSRADGLNFRNGSFGNIDQAQNIVTLDNHLSRTTHEIFLNAHYEYNDWLKLRFSNRHYFSNTVDADAYTNFLPSGSLSIDLAELVPLWPVYDLELYASVSNTLLEAPLLYGNWSYGSTTMSIEDYSTFYEASELFFRPSLAPETERKFETGLKLRVLNRLSMELAYFDNRTTDFIVPVWQTDRFQLQNAATIKNYGATVSAKYSGHISHGGWGIDLTWGKYNSLVEEVYTSDGRIPLAGFGQAQSVLAQDQPVGAIYGTSYMKNDMGERVIGNDGFPLEDVDLKMIGDPIPDWTLGWSSFIEWKQFRFSFLLDFRKGGDVWNGTNAVLDYLGRSAGTGELRNTSDYVFDGVDENNNPNGIPVNFTGPVTPPSLNRWVRYGWDGVGEDYIEDASWIRLNELTLSYTINRSWNQAMVKQVKFSLIGHNLLLITPYSGVDPSTKLFGYGTGNGLDLFNTPAVRSFSAQITIKI